MFCNVLKRLRNQKGITQQELAKYLNISGSAIAMYETGKRMPDYDLMLKISDFFNVDLNFLYEKSVNVHQMTIGERIKQLRQMRELSQEAVADAISTTKQAIYKYENNIVTNIPMDKIIALATFFDVSPSQLMGWEEPSTENVVANKVFQIDEQEKALIKLFRETTQEGRMRIIQAMLNISDEIKRTTFNAKNYNYQ